MTNTKLTKALFPKNGTWITEAASPKGFYVAKYDSKSFTSMPRWFPTLDKAEKYAETL